jgi:hypothetical protein
MADNEIVIKSNTENNSENNIESASNSQMPPITIYSIMSGSVFQSNACNRITDTIMIFFTFGGLGFGALSWFIIDNITAVGYILSGIFSGISLFTIRRMRLRASLQSSVNVLKEENNELKENNDELKENIGELEENIDELEVVTKTLNDDIEMFKNTIGIFGDNVEEIINKLKEVYQDLKKENEIQSSINKNTIYLHILHIIKHFDKNCNFTLSKEKLQKAKKTLLNAFPNLDYENLENKINNNNKITAKKILESVKL